jgi:hypothetical protein
VLEGVVTDYRWANPHVYLSIATVSPSGEGYIQEVEAGPASQLQPRGVTRDLLRPGDRVTVRANPNRRGAGQVLGVELTLTDGSSFPLHARALRALGPTAASATSIEGTWVPEPESYLALARAMRQWPLTELARAVLAGDRADLRTAHANCIPPGPPALMANSVAIAIVANGGTVTFDLGSAQARRVVHLDAEHPLEAEPTLFGHSVGRWLGTELIVDTKSFVPHPNGMGFDFPSSAEKHVVERFSLGTDGKHLDYEITVDDTTYLATPVTYRTRWDYRPEQAPLNEACDPAVARGFLDE